MILSLSSFASGFYVILSQFNTHTIRNRSALAEKIWVFKAKTLRKHQKPETISWGVELRFSTLPDERRGGRSRFSTSPPSYGRGVIVEPRQSGATIFAKEKCLLLSRSRSFRRAVRAGISRIYRHRIIQILVQLVSS